MKENKFIWDCTNIPCCRRGFWVSQIWHGICWAIQVSQVSLLPRLLLVFFLINISCEDSDKIFPLCQSIILQSSSQKLYVRIKAPSIKMKQLYLRIKASSWKMKLFHCFWILYRLQIGLCRCRYPTTSHSFILNSLCWDAFCREFHAPYLSHTAFKNTRNYRQLTK